MTETLYGLTATQHAEVGRIVIHSKRGNRPATQQAERDPHRYRGVARVIMLDDNPVYEPKTKRDCAIFRLNAHGQQKTLEFIGHALEGDLVVRIAGSELRIECRATTAELRAKLTEAGISASDCRATVFPGLWEFDFNGGRWFESAPSMTVEAWAPPAEDLDSPVFSGELRLVQEAWLSVADGGQPKTIETCDWIPFKPGAIKSGAIGAASWSHEAGWLVLAWQCRDYSFRSGG